MLRRKWIPCLAREQRFFLGGGGDQDVTSRVEPWDAAKPYFEDIYSKGSDAFAATNRTPYPGDFLAGSTTYDPLARGFIDLAVDEMGADSQKIRTYAEHLIAGTFLDPSTNPILLNSVTEGIAKARESLLEDVMPQILDMAISGGAYDGTAFDTLQDRALEGFSREALRASTAVYYENFARERAIQHAAPGIFQIVEQIDAERGRLTQANADMLRGLNQIELDDDFKHFQDELQAPWRGIQEFVSVLVGGGFNTSEVHDPSKARNPIGSAMQGAVGGATAGMSVGGPVGGAIGGFLGGIAGLLG